MKRRLDAETSSWLSGSQICYEREWKRAKIGVFSVRIRLEVSRMCMVKNLKNYMKKYENDGLATKTVPAEDIWRAILKSQAETGTPYMLYKDACNKKSNQSNLGTIKSSNLCTEIIEHTSLDETAVCNLASVALPKFVTDGEEKFDYSALHTTIKIMTKNLNNVIDRNFYPVKSAERSNMRHRPIGLGVQGLADVFCSLRLPFDSEEAKKINSYISETIYHASLEASCELSDEMGPYSSSEGSPISKGILQFDMWETKAEIPHSGMYDWEADRREGKEGMRNSLFGTNAHCLYRTDFGKQ